MKAITTILSIAIGSIFTVGCSSLPEAYIPAKVGFVDQGDIHKDIVLTIETDERETQIGEPISFHYTIRNQSTEPVMVPNNPSLRFHFVYPNGRRDNYLKEFVQTRHYSPNELTELMPGEELAGTFNVKTYYFNRRGITEFSAILHAARNTNPALNDVWSGKVKSNSFGVMVNPTTKGKKGLLGIIASGSSRTSPST